jgi:dynein heavy chain
MNKSKPLPDVRKTSPPSSTRIVDATKHPLSGLNALEVAQHLKKHGDDVGFVYLVRAGSKASSDYHAYNLRVALHSAVDQSDYFTMSKAGVTHTHAGGSEFTPLAQWEKEYKDFHALRKMNTFHQFRMWKAFAVWRKNMVKVRIDDRLDKMLKGLFIIDDRLRDTLVEVRRLSLDLRQSTLCVIDGNRTYSLEDFINVQHDQSGIIASKLLKFRRQVLEVVLNACSKALQAAGYADDAPSEEGKGS